MTLSLPPLFCYHEKIFGKKQPLWRNVYSDSQFKSTILMAEESRHRKIESVSHTVCLIRKKREVNACSYSLLPFYAV